MCNHNGGKDSPMQPNINTSDPERPPQFNARNCNFDCDSGCNKDSDDEGGGAEMDGQTVIGEEENVHSDAEAQDESGGESEDLRGSEEFMPDSGESASDGTGSEFLSSLETGDMSVSMVVEPASSGDRSPVICASVPARSLSSNPGNTILLAGLMRVPSPLPMSYYFLQKPLRLSAQIEHCRGDPASHLVAPDRVRLSSLMEQ
ncbi:hypothetical protein COCMIDRAFT_60894, partial [Bipolaris oryzae ATCC 44560]